MRTFLGIDLDDATRGTLAALGESIRAEASEWRAEKWVPPHNLHLTLRFLGEMTSASVDDLADALRQPVSAHTPFALPCLVQVEPVPGRSRARMLWTRYDDPAEACRALARTIDDVAACFGFVPEDRPFVPHVTLARSRRPRPFTPSASHDTVSVPSLSVPAVTIYTSVLTRSAPRYERVARIDLGGR